MPEISIIVPAYNHSRYLRECVLSLLKEQVSDLEIIVIDDGSTDGTSKTVADLPVQLIRNPSNRGVAFSRNLGVHKSSGRMITFFDSDDILAAGGLTSRIAWLKEHPAEQAVCGTFGSFIDSNGQKIPSLSSVKAPERLSLSFYRQGGRWPCACWLFLFHRALLETTPFDESLRFADDCHLVLSLLHHRTIPIIPVPVALHRFHENNISIYKRESFLRMSPRVAAETLLVYLSHGIEPDEYSSPHKPARRAKFNTSQEIEVRFIES